jgi:CheY-like chemotaxis protein
MRTPEGWVSRGRGEAEGSGLRILVAEDHYASRIFVTRLLKKRGHEVRAVEDGGKALESLRERKYDLALFDVQMPGIKGTDLTRMIRAANYPEIDPLLPVIAVTAHAMKGDRESFLDAGMDAYVAKPVEMQELLKVIAGVTGAEA